MLFASAELVSRIERAECGLLADAARAVRARRPEVEPFLRPLAGGLAAWAGAGSPLNKVAGLGFDGAPDSVELEALEHELRRRGSPVQVELSTLAEPSIAPLLSGRGYALVGFENVLGRALPAPPSAREAQGIEVEMGGEGDFHRWLEVVVEGFASPDAQGVASHESFPREMLERVLGDLASAPSFTRYLALREGLPVGGASMRISEGVAQLCGSATVPTHRRRGAQSALLARRLADAALAGCDVAVMTAQPGSKSQQNAQRQGFELLYSRAVLVLGA